MATLFGILAVLLWGMLALLGTFTTRLPPFQLLAICFCISALLMFGKRLYRREPVFTRPGLTLPQWLIGITGLFGFHFCYFLALRRAPAIDVSLIVYIWPLLLALFVANRQTVLKALAGGILGFIGIALIITGDSSLALDQAHWTGYLLAMCCAFIWSSYSFYLSRSDNSVEDIGWLSAAVAILALLAHLGLESGQWQLSGTEWLGALLLGLGPVGGAFYLWDIGLKRGNKSLLASFSFSAPLISSVLLALAGINDWSMNIIIALGLIFTGALINNWPKRAPRLSQPDTA
ncbi:DMT family transporter [Photobacterium atrarenae]|uniref:EamA family transporter n=1 Tax=Photobacterium atrarenae TaxID=865757 RepID=A0ABY5GQ37_9GAMM|nr:EamA family transporter [Photobacterium atrarenae]UTV30627.1 EamA family transporter [Photobacterium atrarenae]